MTPCRVPWIIKRLPGRMGSIFFCVGGRGVGAEGLGDEGVEQELGKQQFFKVLIWSIQRIVLCEMALLGRLHVMIGRSFSACSNLSLTCDCVPGRRCSTSQYGPTRPQLKRHAAHSCRMQRASWTL